MSSCDMSNPVADLNQKLELSKNFSKNPKHVKFKENPLRGHRPVLPAQKQTDRHSRQGELSLFANCFTNASLFCDRRAGS
jgi:hypothetical protein